MQYATFPFYIKAVNDHRLQFTVGIDCNVPSDQPRGIRGGQLFAYYDTLASEGHPAQVFACLQN